MKKIIITLLASVMLLTGCGTTYSYDNDVYLDKFVNIETRYGEYMYRLLGRYEEVDKGE